eukprot:5483787-Prymnesium_polylepis.1
MGGASLSARLGGACACHARQSRAAKGRRGGGEAAAAGRRADGAARLLALLPRARIHNRSEGLSLARLPVVGRNVAAEARGVASCTHRCTACVAVRVSGRHPPLSPLLARNSHPYACTPPPAPRRTRARPLSHIVLFITELPVAIALPPHVCRLRLGLFGVGEDERWRRARPA